MKVIALLAAWAAIVIGGFWRYEFQYLLPRGSSKGTPAAFDHAQAAARGTGKGLELRIAWNPDCPCCQFEEDHVRSLSRDFPKLKIRFLIPDGERSDLDAWQREKLPGVAVLDPLAKQCQDARLYATPGCQIRDSSGAVLFRGSLHAGRFCGSDQLAFARRALEDVASGRLPRVPSIPFFGCEVNGAI